MSGINKVILIGSLGRDPEIKNMPNGTAVAKFSIATSENWKDKETNEKKSQTEWHNIVAFGRLAEICGQYLRKGSKVYVEGKLKTRSWEKDGVKRYSTEIVIKELQMLDSKGQQQSSGGYQQQSQSGGYQPPAQQQSQPQHYQKAAESKAEPQGHAQPKPTDFGDFDDDIPF